MPSGDGLCPPYVPQLLAAGPMLYSLPGPRRCVPATCTSPSAASRGASRLGHGHQLNATGGSSSPSGSPAAAAPGHSPQPPGSAAPPRWAGSGCPVPGSPPGPATSPPAGRNPARLAVPPCKGKTTYSSPTDASVTRASAPPSGTTGRAANGAWKCISTWVFTWSLHDFHMVSMRLVFTGSYQIFTSGDVVGVSKARSRDLHHYHAPSNVTWTWTLD